MYDYAWLIILLPVLAFVVIGLIGRRLPQGGGHVAVGAVAGSTALSAYLLVEVLRAGALGTAIAVEQRAFLDWIPGLEAIRMGLLIDNLSALMLLLVSFLSLLITVYSLGYMREEEGKPRYNAENSRYIAGKLGTVSSANFLQHI
ncbi:MAG: hypothetical protein ACT4OI_09335, partial [Methanobacteriota archaeon]